MSKVIIKNFDDIQKITQACEIWKKAKKVLIDFITEGVTTLQIDQLAKKTIESYDAKPTFYMQYGFKGNVCISVNECVIHGVPSNYKLKAGDKVTVDMGVTFQKHICDAAFTVIVGENNEAQKISSICEQAIYEACKIIVPNKTTNMDIAKTIQGFVESNGYHILRGFTGHGCGNYLHEEPMIPNYLDDHFETCVLKPNMVICIEPMILAGSKEYYVDPIDKWSVISKQHNITAHWEHMILITETGFQILTGE